MAMSSGGADKKAVQSEINVTPLIDVLLVLLIIFLVVMPIMMKMETLEIPRKLEDNQTVDEKAVMITITLNPGGSVTFDENGKEIQINVNDLLSTLRPKLEGWTSPGEKVVFVHFHNDIEWNDVVTTMDSIRSLATDANHDEIKVALKIKEDPADAAAKPLRFGAGGRGDGASVRRRGAPRRFFFVRRSPAMAETRSTLGSRAFTEHDHGNAPRLRCPRDDRGRGCLH